MSYANILHVYSWKANLFFTPGIMGPSVFTFSKRKLNLTVRCPMSVVLIRVCLNLHGCTYTGVFKPTTGLLQF